MAEKLFNDEKTLHDLIMSLPEEDKNKGVLEEYELVLRSVPTEHKGIASDLLTILSQVAEHKANIKGAELTPQILGSYLLMLEMAVKKIKEKDWDSIKALSGEEGAKNENKAA